MQTNTRVQEHPQQQAATTRHGLLSPLVIALGTVLVLQLVAALALGLGGRTMEPAGSQGPLVVFEPDQVTGIRIQASESEPVLVTKTETGWIIPSLQDLPAAEHKVTGLLSKLEGLEKGLPVATSDEALKRFKVGDQAFERKLTLEAGDAPPAIIYLGDSPGFRRLFVRTDEDNAVYEAELGLFDAPHEADDWSDQTLLHLKADDLKRLSFAEVNLVREEDAWRLADLAEGEEQDEQAVEDAVRNLTNMDFLGVLADEEKPAANEEAIPIEIEATLAAGETITYRLTELAEGNDYLLEVSNRPQRFRLAGYAAEDLSDLGRADLLKEAEETAESPPEMPPAEAAENEGASRATENAMTPSAQVQDAGETGSVDQKGSEANATAPMPETSDEPAKAQPEP